MISLEVLREKVSSCTACPELAAGRIQTVFGVGPAPARLMFIGEAPGADEDKQGEPFVGAAGKLLNNIINACGWKREDIYICNILKCLDGYSTVLTENGWKRINWLVKTKYVGKVACVDDDGNLCWRNVINHYRTNKGDRTMFQISLKHSRKSRNGSGAIMTEDHPVLTKRGFVRVQDLQPTDMIHTGTFQPGKEKEQALIGTLLGDSQYVKCSNSFSCRHGYKQLPYLLHKAALVSRQMKTILYYRDGYFSVGFETPTNPWHRMMCQMLYGSGTKTITNEILNKFGIISLAYLYMDDGHRNKKNLCEIATCSFSPPEVDLLIDKINTIGIKSYRRPNSKYPRVYFDKPNSEKLCETIKDFVVPCMGYKLLPAFRGNFQNSVSNDKDIPFYDAFDLVERKDKTYNKVYCIDVDEFHNFITHSGVVHNCRPPGNRRPTEEESNNCRGYLDQQIQVVKPEWIVCWGATAGSNLLQQAKAGATQLRQKVFDYQGAKVICTYHPAYLLPHRKPEKKRDVWDDLQIVIKGLKDNEN